VDGRNVFNPNEAIAAGFDYTGIGRRVRQAKRSEAVVAQT
jgi:orotidine-5'-phosphate decarboxylase